MLKNILKNVVDIWVQFDIIDLQGEHNNKTKPRLTQEENMDKKYRSTEVTVNEAEALRIFLKENEIDYEPSQCGDLIHFELLVTDEETEIINDFIDTL